MPLVLIQRVMKKQEMMDIFVVTPKEDLVMSCAYVFAVKSVL